MGAKKTALLKSAMRHVKDTPNEDSDGSRWEKDVSQAC